MNESAALALEIKVSSNGVKSWGLSLCNTIKNEQKNKNEQNRKKTRPVGYCYAKAPRGERLPGTIDLLRVPRPQVQELGDVQHVE